MKHQQVSMLKQQDTHLQFEHKQKKVEKAENKEAVVKIKNPNEGNAPLFSSHIIVYETLLLRLYHIRGFIRGPILGRQSCHFPESAK